jgi:quercetin dioxygenase-like cupin family protein
MSTLIQGARLALSEEGERLNALGDRQRVILKSEDTGGKYTLIEDCNAPGVSVPLHLHHNEDEMFYVVEGQVEFKIGHETINASAGTTVYLPRNTPHALTIVGDVPAKMLVVLTPGGLEKFFEELSQLPSEEPPDIKEVMAISSRYGVELYL